MKREKKSTIRRRPVVEELECRRLLALNPTPEEQEFMQLVNRFRTYPTSEYTRLIASPSPIRSRDPILQDDLDFANVNGYTLRAEMQALSPVPPVAWNEAIRDFSMSHNARMISARSQFHSNTLQRRQELLAAGVNLRFANGEIVTSENVFGHGKSPLHLFAGYVIDWQRGSPGGMQTGRPHRTSIMNDDFEQAGLAISTVGGTGFGPKVNTQVLANIENPPVMVTGAIFQDHNGSRWYDAGEGLRSVQFVFEGAAGTFTTTGLFHGGYQIELPPGVYNATASGGGMRYTQRMNNIVVGDVNVWKNWIYDPDVIPPDQLESNNTIATATQLTGSNESHTGLSIHAVNDTDYFRMLPVGNGTMQVDLQFAHANGDVDVQVQSVSGAVLASSTSTTNNESLTLNVQRDTVYLIRVFGKPGATNGSYSISVTTPEAAPPVANPDRATFSGSAARIIIDARANDTDRDGVSSRLTPVLADGTSSAFSLTTAGTVAFQPIAGQYGMQRATYWVTDDQQLSSNPSTITVFVIDFSSDNPWQNAGAPLDVNGDGVTSPLDALLVINELNQRDARMLPTSAVGADPLFGYLDASGDGFISPLDALLIINGLNGGGEGEADGHGVANDAALEQLAAAHSYQQLVTERRRTAEDLAQLDTVLATERLVPELIR